MYLDFVKIMLFGIWMISVAWGFFRLWWFIWLGFGWFYGRCAGFSIWMIGFFTAFCFWWFSWFRFWGFHRTFWFACTWVFFEGFLHFFSWWLLELIDSGYNECFNFIVIKQHLVTFIFWATLFVSLFALPLDFASSLSFGLVEMWNKSFCGGCCGGTAKLITKRHWRPIDRSIVTNSNTKSHLLMTFFDWICTASESVLGGSRFNGQYSLSDFNWNRLWNQSVTIW